MPATAADDQAGRPGRQAAAQKVDDGYRTSLRLGGARSITRPIRDLAALKKIAGTPRMQKDYAAVLDQAGLSSLAPEVVQILRAGDAAVLKETNFAIGSTMEWMALRNKGKPDIIRNLRWGGQKPFPAWEFFIDDGNKGYTFVLPKACGNLLLAKTGPSPKAEAAAAAESARRAEEGRRAEEARRVEAARKAEESRKAEEEARRQAELRRPPACGVNTTRSYAKGVWTFNIDASGAAKGDPPAASVTVTAFGLDGKPMMVTREGKLVSEVTLTAPFQTAVTARKLKPGTYTVKVVATRNNSVAPTSTCEASAVIEQMEQSSWFFEADMGKERRVRENKEIVVAPAAAVPLAGFCSPLLGTSVGYNFLLSDTGWSVAPRVGLAINFDVGDQSSVFAELEVNRWFAERKAFFGVGLGWWDFNHSDTDDGTVLIHFGRSVYETQRGGKLFFMVEGRMFTSQIDDLSNNYNVWGGLRYIFR
jgi:hypothetical protein